MRLEEKIGQMCFVGFDGIEAPPHILEWLAAGRIGGVILFARNIGTPKQVAALTQSLHEAARYPILIAVDQEGGTVSRLKGKPYTESPGAMALGAADSESLAEDMAAAVGAELRAMGINWNLAPVLDISHNIENASVGTRSLGADTDRVGILGAAQVRGLRRSGIAATAKHFPGIGNTRVDTHVALAVVTGSLDYLWQHDLKPFQVAAAAGVDVIMMSHVRFDELDAQYPSTLSPVVVQQLLRQDIGFDGVACTDCMEMKAITDNFGAGEAAVLAAVAGVDIVFHSHTHYTQTAAYDALLVAARSGRLPESRIDEAFGRIQALKQRYAITEPPRLDQIGSTEHQRIAQKAARAGTVLVKSDRSVFPLPARKRIGLVEFASYMDSEVMERGGLSGFASLIQAAVPVIDVVSIPASSGKTASVEDARQLAQDVDVLVLATRNAHLIPEQARLAGVLLELAEQAILVCLRNPYDVSMLPGADTILCTCGDSTPSMQAAVDVLTGRYHPTGRVPVPIS
jgi:beta-N-acetylhexosaminidase